MYPLKLIIFYTVQTWCSGGLFLCPENIRHSTEWQKEYCHSVSESISNSKYELRGAGCSLLYCISISITIHIITWQNKFHSKQLKNEALQAWRKWSIWLCLYVYHIVNSCVFPCFEIVAGKSKINNNQIKHASEVAYVTLQYSHGNSTQRFVSVVWFGNRLLPLCLFLANGPWTQLKDSGLSKWHTAVLLTA